MDINDAILEMCYEFINQIKHNAFKQIGWRNVVKLCDTLICIVDYKDVDFNLLIYSILFKNAHKAKTNKLMKKLLSSIIKTDIVLIDGKFYPAGTQVIERYPVKIMETTTYYIKWA